MTVERFSLVAELLPFLSGDIRIVEMTMQKPKLDLEVDESGTVAWTSPQSAIVDAEQIEIEKLTIEGGTAKLSGLAGGREVLLENINANVSARSLLGPWRIDANADIEDVPSRLDISTGTYQHDVRSIRLKIEALRKDRPYRLLIDGPLKLEENVLNWSGDFDLKPYAGKDLSISAKAETPLPFHLDGLFLANPNSVKFSEYRLEIGAEADPYVITGQGETEIRERVFFKVQADGRQIDLDRLKDATGADVAEPNLQTRLASLKSIIDRIPVPDANGEVDIMLPAIVAGDTFIRDIKTKIRPYGKGWDIRSMQALFPGNTLVEAKGRIGLREDFGFSGELLVASRQPSGFASWVSGDVAPQIRKLRTLGLESRVSLSQKQTIFDDLELRLDDAVLRGKLQRIGGENIRPAIIAELSGNLVNTENLRALYSLMQGQDTDDFKTHDLNIKLEAEQLETVIGDISVEAKSVAGQIQVRDGSVAFQDFKADEFFGASIESTGRIEDVLAKPNGNLQLEVKAKNGNELLSFLNDLSGEHPAFAPILSDTGFSSDLSLEVEVDTNGREDGAEGIVIASGQVADTIVDARLSFNGDLSNLYNLPIDLNAKLNNDDPSVLLGQLGIETLKDPLGAKPLGALSISASAIGSAQNGLDGLIGASWPGTNLSAAGQFMITPEHHSFYDLNVTLGSSDVLPAIRLLDVPLPILEQDVLPVSMRGRLITIDQGIAFKRFDGQFAGKSFSGDLNLQRENVSRPKLSGEVKTESLDVLLLADAGFGRTKLLSVGGGILSNVEFNFAAPLYPNMDADVLVEADAISIGDLISGTQGRSRFVMIDGALDINEVAMQALGGELSGSASFENSEGNVLASGNLLIEGADFSQVLSAANYPEIATGTVKATGSFESNGRSLAGLVSSLSGNGYAQVSGLELTGVDPDGFKQILAEADTENYEIVSDDIRALTDESVLDGALAIGTLDAPIAFTLGKMRIRNVSHDTGGALLTGELETELLSGDTQAELSVRFQPSKRDQITGATPQFRVSWDGTPGLLEQSVDTGQLEGYLALRAFENSQRRIETLEARVIEKQRHLRQIALLNSKADFNKRKQEQAQRERELELQRLQAEEEQRRIEAERKLREEQDRKQAEKREAAERARQLQAEKAAKAAEAEKKKQAEQSGIVSEPLKPLAPAQKPAANNSNLFDSLDDFLSTQ